MADVRQRGRYRSLALAAPGPLRWAAAGLLIGAAVLAASASARAENVFRFAFQGNLNTLDSYQYNETFTTATMSNVYEGLTQRDQEMKIVPALATSWEVTDDGLKWRVHLREGVKFANGDAVHRRRRALFARPAAGPGLGHQGPRARPT